MSLDDVCSVSITSSGAAPTRPGFGTPLIMASKLPAGFVGKTQLYGSLAEMVTAGFLVTDPAYLCATAICSQNPKVAQFKVGRRTLPQTQSLKLQCLSAVQGDVYNVTINATPITYTVLSSATTTTVAAAIETLIAAVSGITASAATDTITFAETAAATGALCDVSGWTSNFHFFDATTDPGIATDLAAVNAVDSNWYGVCLDSQSKAEILAAAAWTEANGKLFTPNTSDSDCFNSGISTDVMSVVKADAYARTGVLFCGSHLLSYSGPAWMGNGFPINPGAATWAYKTLAGVTVDNLQEGQHTAIINKNGNTYEVIAGVNLTQGGQDGAGEWIDTVRFLDWLRSEMQIQVLSMLASALKIPYTNKGINRVATVIKGVLSAGVDAGGLAAGDATTPAPDVQVPDANAVDAVTKGQRKLTGVTFSGKLAGAIHQLTLTGTVSV